MPQTVRDDWELSALVNGDKNGPAYATPLPGERRFVPDARHRLSKPALALLERFLFLVIARVG